MSRNLPIFSHAGMTKEIIGKKFNRLTVIKQDGSYKTGTKLFLCKCECGGSTKTSASHLKRGEVKSCGCLVKEVSSKNGKNTKKDILNMKFGRLLVLKENGRSKHGVKWLCKCDCGNEKTVLGVALRRGTKSCGCINKEISVLTGKLKRAKDPWLVEMYHYSNGAEVRSLLFKISKKYFIKLVTSDCYYCGNTPQQTCYSAELKENKVKRNGIDRIDNNIGYIKSNCVPCCKTCNFEKRAQTYEQFIENTKRRFEHLIKKGILY